MNLIEWEKEIETISNLLKTVDEEIVVKVCNSMWVDQILLLESYSHYERILMLINDRMTFLSPEELRELYKFIKSEEQRIRDKNWNNGLDNCGKEKRNEKEENK